MNGSALRIMQSFKYLRHVLAENGKNDLDIERDRRAISFRCNMLARKFVKCSDDVKLTLFNSYCQCFYICQLWFDFTRKSDNAIRVQCNDAFRILMQRPRTAARRVCLPRLG
jgi:hypothetical protein